jgi:hypothetical protein
MKDFLFEGKSVEPHVLWGLEIIIIMPRGSEVTLIMKLERRNAFLRSCLKFRPR